MYFLCIRPQIKTCLSVCLSEFLFKCPTAGHLRIVKIATKSQENVARKAIKTVKSPYYGTMTTVKSLAFAVGVEIVQIFCTNDKETIIFQHIFMIEYLIFELGCSNSEKSVKMRSKQQAYTHVVKST